MRFGELIGRGRLISSPNQKRSPRPAYSYERIKGIGLALLAMPILLVRPAIGIEIDTIFEKSCAGCHLGGGNVLGGRTLKLKDLEAMEMLNTESLFKNIYYGNRRMPGFGTDCQPQGQCTFGPRLSDDEIQSLAEFVLKQAKSGWQ